VSNYAQAAIPDFEALTDFGLTSNSHLEGLISVFGNIVSLLSSLDRYQMQPVVGVARKSFIRDVLAAEREDSDWRFSDGKIWQYVWVQGVVIDEKDGWLTLDDGSGLLYVYHREMTNAAKEASYPSCAIEGRYILAMGAIVQRDGDNNLVGVACSKLVDLSQQPEREPLWWMEVAAQDV